MDCIRNIKCLQEDWSSFCKCRTLQHSAIWVFLALMPEATGFQACRSWEGVWGGKLHQRAFGGPPSACYHRPVALLHDSNPEFHPYGSWSSLRDPFPESSSWNSPTSFQWRCHKSHSTSGDQLKPLSHFHTQSQGWIWPHNLWHFTLLCAVAACYKTHMLPGFTTRIQGSWQRLPINV